MEKSIIQRFEARLEGLSANPTAYRVIDGVDVYRLAEDVFTIPRLAPREELTLGQAARVLAGERTDRPRKPARARRRAA